MSNTSCPISPARARSIARFNAACIAWDGQAYLAAISAFEAEKHIIAAEDEKLFAAYLEKKKQP